MNIHAALGMAIYTGRLNLEDLARSYFTTMIGIARAYLTML